MSDSYIRQWAEAEPRIDEGIETHRKSDATLRLLDHAGTPIAGRRVTIEQVSSDVLFGANLFMIDAYQGESAQRYENAYGRLFNAGTAALCIGAILSQRPARCASPRTAPLSDGARRWTRALTSSAGMA